MVDLKGDLERMQQMRSPFRPLLIGLHWPSKPWGDEDLESRGVSFSLTETTPVEQFVDEYAQRIADTEASRQALETIFQTARDEEVIVSSVLPQKVRLAYETLDQEAALGNDGEGAAPGSDREAFDLDKISYALAQEEEIVSSRGLSWDGILAPLRILSFWKMKDRARQFGERGAFKLLADLQQVASSEVRFHLMGHSFGCIVVSGMLAGPNDDNRLVRPVNSVALIQGALSLWSYCSDIPKMVLKPRPRPGYFHSIIAERKVKGAIITTQSVFDTAVGKMYPYGAGIVYSDIDFAPGQLPNYGGLGTFGARGPGLEIVDMPMLLRDGSYQFEPGKIYNLESSKFICDGTDGGLGGAHNDIAKPEVAHAVWSAAFSS